jgi:hypothetical protein
LTPNELVRRDDLLNDVWDKFNLTPSDSNLNKNISLIRKALSELGIKKSIETIKKQGFALTLSVEIVSGDLADTMLKTEQSNAGAVVKKVSHRWLFAIGTSVVLFSLSFLYLFNSTDNGHGFSYFGKVGLCEVYSQESAKTKSIEAFINSPAGKNVTRKCEETHKVIYIDDSKLNIESVKKETFMAVCDVNKSGGRNECKNYVFL